MIEVLTSGPAVAAIVLWALFLCWWYAAWTGARSEDYQANDSDNNGTNQF